MKIISLNIWGGHLESALLAFISHYKYVDIFCLQEVYSNANKMITNEERYVCLSIFEKIQAQLPEHTGLFLPIVNEVYGIAMFVKKSVEIIATESLQIYHNPDYTSIGPNHDRYSNHT
jgi:exonuclease III